MRASDSVKSSPIIFSGPMVRAILDGRKTVTRRVVKHLGVLACTTGDCPHEKQTECDEYALTHSPYGAPGDELWVREAFCLVQEGIIYRANSGVSVEWPDDFHADERAAMFDARGEDWRSPIYIPRWASRLTLEVVSVRVERLQEITEEDALAEGVEKMQFYDYLDAKGRNCGLPSGISMPGPYARAFSKGWDTLNGKRAPWASNPWVWVVGFRRKQA